jgi:ABC-type branched-subunit amino acid transport system ATPase component
VSRDTKYDHGAGQPRRHARTFHEYPVFKELSVTDNVSSPAQRNHVRLAGAVLRQPGYGAPKKSPASAR